MQLEEVFTNLTVAPVASFKLHHNHHNNYTNFIYFSYRGYLFLIFQWIYFLNKPWRCLGTYIFFLDSKIRVGKAYQAQIPSQPELDNGDEEAMCIWSPNSVLNEEDIDVSLKFNSILCLNLPSWKPSLLSGVRSTNEGTQLLRGSGAVYLALSQLWHLS